MFLKKGFIAILVIVLSTVVAAFTVKELKARSNPLMQNTSEQSLQVEIKQMPSSGGVVPVEIREAKTSLTSSNEISDYNCVIRNNSSKGITALSLTVTIEIQVDGKKVLDRSFQGLDTFLHPDVRDSHNLREISPGR